jgi:quercetin dioxygenase-like cupin family protein
VTQGLFGVRHLNAGSKKMKKTTAIAGLALLSALLLSCQDKKGDTTMQYNTVFPRGEQGPEDYFTNTTWVNMLHPDTDGVYDTQVYDVIFAPSARTYWHSHPGGQILLVTDGSGYYQEKGKPARSLKPGDVVPIPPDVVHWHGAAPDSHFVHVGMSTKVHLGPAKWFGAVTDEEYADATGK